MDKKNSINITKIGSVFCEKGITATPWRHYNNRSLWSVNLFFNTSYVKDAEEDKDIKLQPFETICVVANTPFVAVQKALSSYKKNIEQVKKNNKEKKEEKEKNEKVTEQKSS